MWMVMFNMQIRSFQRCSGSPEKQNGPRRSCSPGETKAGLPRYHSHCRGSPHGRSCTLISEGVRHRLGDIPSAARLPGDTSQASLPRSTMLAALCEGVVLNGLSRSSHLLFGFLPLYPILWQMSMGRCLWKVYKFFAVRTGTLSAPSPGDGIRDRRPACGDRENFLGVWGCAAAGAMV